MMEGAPLRADAEKLLTLLFKENERRRGAYVRFDNEHKAGLESLTALRAALRNLEARKLAEQPLLSSNDGAVRARITEEGILYWEVNLRY